MRRDGSSRERARRVKLELTSGEVRGCGDEVRLALKAIRRKKPTGAWEWIELELDADRWLVGELLDSINAMHVRDRKRIESELARITAERGSLQP